MPLNVTVSLNGTPLNNFHIGRLKGGTEPDDVNLYAVVASDRPDDSRIKYADWLNAPQFEHRYGDGFEVCVQKALQAYLNADPIEETQEQPPAQ